MAQAGAIGARCLVTTDGHVYAWGEGNNGGGPGSNAKHPVLVTVKMP